MTAVQSQRSDWIRDTVWCAVWGWERQKKIMERITYLLAHIVTLGMKPVKSCMGDWKTPQSSRERGRWDARGWRSSRLIPKSNKVALDVISLLNLREELVSSKHGLFMAISSNICEGHLREEFRGGSNKETVSRYTWVAKLFELHHCKKVCVKRGRLWGRGWRLEESL